MEHELQVLVLLAGGLLGGLFATFLYLLAAVRTLKRIEKLLSIRNMHLPALEPPPRPLLEPFNSGHRFHDLHHFN